jgi:hypothetical protein
LEEASNYRTIHAASFDEFFLNGCAPIPCAGAGIVNEHRYTV